MKRISLIGVIVMAWLASPVFAQQPSASLDELLDRVEQGRVKDNAENKAREQRFLNDKANQQALLDEARNTRAALERRGEELESTFEQNEIRTADLTEALNKRLGSLKELFGVLQQVAGDSRAQFENSLTSAEPTIRDSGDPDRLTFLTELGAKMGTSARLASIEEIERLWFELQREMTQSGKVVRFEAPVIMADGNQQELEITRVGAFNLVIPGKYLQYTPETGNISELPRQPRQTRFIKTTGELAGAAEGQVLFALDPTRGQILSLLMQQPDLRERIDQGGTVGYIIIVLGIIALLISLERLVYLLNAGRKVNAQLKSEAIEENNPLGRILKVAQDNRDLDRETLELKLSEAIFREKPSLERALLFLKIISVVAPLMGLLGTVTGMIVTFQAITLFGTGDPKLMAGGISQALVTTVLGLTVAIPTVLLHTLINGRSRRILHLLQEQATGIIAEREEQAAV